MLHDTPERPRSKSAGPTLAPAARAALPYRGAFGAPRPAALGELALPPGAMPARFGLRPLKAWRYVGVFCPQLMICVAAVRIGRARQSFWAVWDRQAKELHQRTSLGSGGVALSAGSAQVHAGRVAISLTLTETAGIETVCPSGPAYAWTRKQGGIQARGTFHGPDGRVHEIDGLAVVDDTAGYYQRHTRWRWSAGVGSGRDGRGWPGTWSTGSTTRPPAASGRCGSTAGRTEVAPVRFAADLSEVGELRFDSEATRERGQNLVLVRSRYRQPFGTFRGRLPGWLGAGSGARRDGGARRVVVMRLSRRGAGGATRPAAAWSASHRSAHATAAPPRR